MTQSEHRSAFVKPPFLHREGEKKATEDQEKHGRKVARGHIVCGVYPQQRQSHERHQTGQGHRDGLGEPKNCH